MQRRLAVFITGVDIGSVFHQKSNHLYIASRSSPMQSRLPFITGVDIASVFDQKANHLYIASKRGPMQSRPVAFIYGR